MPVTPRYNDFVVKFANVNGSGSASANGLFAKGVMRMGVPVAARNIFPSNIPGLPTWYEVRITEEGHLGRRGGVDLMVAMNPQTWDKDVAEIESGGFLFYDSTKPMPASAFREDIAVSGSCSSTSSTSEPCAPFLAWSPRSSRRCSPSSSRAGSG
jgi:2-oxoglutarate ferredoxin oxidoreductase subunit alpha